MRLFGQTKKIHMGKIAVTKSHKNMWQNGSHESHKTDFVTAICHMFFVTVILPHHFENFGKVQKIGRVNRKFGRVNQIFRQVNGMRQI